MPGYLLLRNNKETGPFTLEQLVALSLKQYDLVWVEGKSAGWRYPGEIEELKSHAPAIGEQPYDRFYKKQVPESHPALEQSQQASATPSVVQDQEPVPVVKENTTPSVAPSKKHVAVTMPGQSASKQPAAQVENIVPPPPPINPVTEPQQDFSAPKVEVKRKSEPLVLEEKYSMPLDDIKQMYVENLLQNKNKKASSRYDKKNLKMMAGIAAFLLLIITVGYFIAGDKKQMAKEQMAENTDDVVKNSGTEVSSDADEQKEVASDNHSISTVKKATSANANHANSKKISSNTEDVTKKKSNQKAITPETAPPVAVTDIPSASVKNEKSVTPVTNTSNPEKNRGSVVVTVPVTEEKATDKPLANATGSEAEKQWMKKKIRKMLVVNDPVFKTGLLGGIREVSVSLSNHSKYRMDMVVVELDYLKANDNVVKTEKIYFKNIAPNATVNIEAPSSPQGTKLDYRITLIVSNDLQYYYAGN